MGELYGVPKGVGDPPRLVPAVLDAKELQRQARFMWELAPRVCKLVHKEYMADEATQGGRPDPSMPGFTTMFWRRLMATSMAAANLSEWAVLAELALVMVPGSVEAERMFSTLSFLKNKLRNRLTTHLSPCARIYNQSSYTLADFPFHEAIKAW